MAGLVAPVDVPARHVADEEHHPHPDWGVHTAHVEYAQEGHEDDVHAQVEEQVAGEVGPDDVPA